MNKTSYPLEFQTANVLLNQKVALYVRVSTDKQECENQLLQLRAYAKKSGFKIYKEYVDIISGKEDKRPSWDSLFSDAHKKLFDILLFWDLSRFSRSGTLYTLQKLQELENLGIGYISYQDPYLNTIGEFKEVWISIRATFAKMQRKQISDNTKAGLERVRKNGVKLGRSAIPDETISQIQDLLKQGLSINDIHKQVRYRIKSGELRHVSIGKISGIKKTLSKKEGAFSD